MTHPSEDDFVDTGRKLNEALSKLASALKIERFPGAAQVPDDVRALRAVRQVLGTLKAKT